MKIRYILIFLIAVFISCGSGAGKIKMKIRGKSLSVSSVTQKGLRYASLNELASALGAKTYRSPVNGKEELKFKSGHLKFTPANQFIVFTPDSGNAQVVYQVPVALIGAADDIFIPLIFCRDILAGASGVKLDYSETPAETAEIIHSQSGKRVELNENNDTIGVILNEQKPAAAGAPRYDASDSPDAEAPSGTVLEVSYEEKANGTLVRLKSSRSIGKYKSEFSGGKFFVLIEGAAAQAKSVRSAAAAGLVKSLSTGIRAGWLELAFNLRSGCTGGEVFPDPAGNGLMVTLHSNALSKISLPDPKKEKWNLNAVVIDAGHGGRDPGAIGVNGEKEKDINLAIAHKLGEAIKKNIPGVRVIYTRTTDKFVELYKRGKIANEQNGKLFISIHCNSTPQKPVATNGFEIYLLRPGRTKEAISIAELENKVIEYEGDRQRYKALTDENFILVSMAHSSYMRYSEQFSDLLNSSLRQELPLKSEGIKQAGFYVLVGASMPGVLLETGYMSNIKDMKYLSSKTGQRQIAETICRAIACYKSDYEKSL